MLQSMGLKRAAHNLATEQQHQYKMHIIVGIVAFIVMVTIISIVNKKREEKELNEPLY